MEGVGTKEFSGADAGAPAVKAGGGLSRKRGIRGVKRRNNGGGLRSSTIATTDRTIVTKDSRVVDYEESWLRLVDRFGCG